LEDYSSVDAVLKEKVAGAPPDVFFEPGGTVPLVAGSAQNEGSWNGDRSPLRFSRHKAMLAHAEGAQ
jgi:hypothetical protein